MLVRITSFACVVQFNVLSDVSVVKFILNVLGLTKNILDNSI